MPRYTVSSCESLKNCYRTAIELCAIAQSVFKAVLQGGSVERVPVSVQLVHRTSLPAVHRLDTPAGRANNWQGKGDEIS